MHGQPIIKIYLCVFMYLRITGASFSVKN